ncbi:MAG: hypothetical protein QME40_07370 [bacterium]|nr:hypothetical protein [bacterium]
MKRLGSIIGMISLAVLLFAVPKVDAAESGTIDVTVTIQNISVSIDPASYDFGAVALGSKSQSTTAITVTNDGNVNEDYSLNLTNPSPPSWTAMTTTGAPGAEKYTLEAAFDADGTIAWGNDQATPNDNHILTTTITACTASKYAGDQTGVNVPANGARTLYLRFWAPSSTGIFTQQTIPVTVTAAKSP